MVDASALGVPLSLYGGLGNDTLKGGSGGDALYGDEGNDIIEGNAGNDYLYGDGSGNGVSTGNDTLRGGEGNDNLWGDDAYNGGTGNDILEGGNGSDATSFIGKSSLTLTDTSYTAGPVTVPGHSIEAWTVRGTPGNDSFDASLFTLSWITMYGYAGNDTLKGGSGGDALYGDEGNDIIEGNAGNDYLYGDGSGNGVSTGNDTLRGGEGNDNLWGDDAYNGGTGNDILEGGGGRDAMYGSGGTDTATITGSSVTLNDSSYAVDGLTITGHAIETWTLLGTDLNDTLDASAWTGAGVTIVAGLGDDVLKGGAGNDTLDASAWTGAGLSITGLAGDDTLKGGSGADTISAGEGNDLILGGGGTDSASDIGSNLVLTNTTYTANGVVSTTHAVENWTLTGTSGNDTIDASAWTGAALSISGLAGDDTLKGGSGNDTVDGGDGSDTLNGGTGTNTVAGGTGTNTLVITGTSATDTIVVNATNATLNGVTTSFTNIQTVEVFTAGGNDSVTKSTGVTIPVLIQDVAPTVQASLSGLVVSGSFTDQGDSQTWTATIDIGNGAGQQPLTLNANKTFSYTLASPPTADIVIRVTDNRANVGSATITNGPLSDIQVTSATTNGNTTFSLTYQIVGVAATAFQVGVYSSTDATFGSDTALATLSISAPADLTVGTHTKTYTIGSLAGQVPLPGAGATEVDTDYFLLAVADPADLVSENDLGGIQEDNVGVITGAYFSGQGPVMIQGGSGADTIAVSGAVTITVNSTPITYTASKVTGLRVRTHGGNDTLSAAAFTKPTVVFGGDGSDSLTTGTSTDLLSGGAGDDSLTGGSANDTYLFDADTSLGTDTLTEAATSAGGIDKLDFSATSSLGVSVNLGDATLAGQTVSTNLALKLSAANAFEQLVGGEANDTLTGNTLANLLVGNGGNDKLIGGTGNDTYAFDVDLPLGIDTLEETAASGGVDLLSFVDTTGVAVSADLSVATSQAVHATNLSLILGSVSLFENVTGGSMNDTLAGNTLANILLGGPGNDTLTGRDGTDTLEGQAGNDSLVGSGGNDLYRFDADTALGSDSITESAGADVDTVDFALTTTQAVALNFG